MGKTAEPAKNSVSPHAPPQLQKHRNKAWWGAANQPVRPEADKWEGNSNLVRATQGVKATEAFRSREQQLGCYERAAAPTSIMLAPLFVPWYCCVPGELCHSDFIPFHSVADF